MPRPKSETWFILVYIAVFKLCRCPHLPNRKKYFPSKGRDVAATETGFCTHLWPEIDWHFCYFIAWFLKQHIRILFKGHTKAVEWASHTGARSDALWLQDKWREGAPLFPSPPPQVENQVLVLNMNTGSDIYPENHMQPWDACTYPQHTKANMWPRIVGSRRALTCSIPQKTTKKPGLSLFWKEVFTRSKWDRNG